MRPKLKAVEERVAPVGSCDAHDREFILDLPLAYGNPQGNVIRLRKGWLHVADHPAIEVAQKNVDHIYDQSYERLVLHNRDRGAAGE